MSFLPINNFIKSNDGEAKENIIPVKPLLMKVSRSFLLTTHLTYFNNSTISKLFIKANMIARFSIISHYQFNII